METYKEWLYSERNKVETLIERSRAISHISNVQLKANVQSAISQNGFRIEHPDELVNYLTAIDNEIDRVNAKEHFSFDGPR